MEVAKRTQIYKQKVAELEEVLSSISTKVKDRL